MMRMKDTDGAVIGRRVHVAVDRPLGSRHPSYPDLVYKVNYGFVPGVTGGDGEEQDAYVLGVTEPVERFDGVVIAVIKRLEDREEKWVVASEDADFSEEEILAAVEFQEQYFTVNLLRDEKREGKEIEL